MVINRILEHKKVDQVLRGAFMPTKKTGKGKGKGPNAKKGQANKPTAGGSKKGKGKPRKRNNAKKGGAKASEDKAGQTKQDDTAAAKKDNQCKSQPRPDPDCQ